MLNSTASTNSSVPAAAAPATASTTTTNIPPAYASAPHMIMPTYNGCYASQQYMTAVSQRMPYPQPGPPPSPYMMPYQHRMSTPYVPPPLHYAQCSMPSPHAFDPAAFAQQPSFPPQPLHFNHHMRPSNVSFQMQQYYPSSYQNQDSKNGFPYIE